MSEKLGGKVAIITGAVRGLGREYYLRLAKEGASIIAGDISDCSETINQITNMGGSSINVELELTDPLILRYGC